MVEENEASKSGGYTGMPKWPKDARDVPEPYRPGGGDGGKGGVGQYAIVGLMVGLFFGGVPLIESLHRGELSGAEGAGRITGWLFFGGLFSFFGHMIDRRRSMYDR